MSINIDDVNPGDELTVRVGRLSKPEYWATLTGKVHRDSVGYLALGTVPVRYPGGGILAGVREIVSHTPAKPAEPAGRIGWLRLLPDDAFRDLVREVEDGWSCDEDDLPDFPSKHYPDAVFTPIATLPEGHVAVKPAEPEHIGAAVEDADGQVWVRVLWSSPRWRDTKHYRDGVRNYRRYDDIDVVRVLHEGWPA